MTHAVMETPTRADEFDAVDEFDLDVRIAVNTEIHSPEGSSSNWLSCKGTCSLSLCFCGGSTSCRLC
ncbi:FDLD family class I lanthipeptide [Streptomyces sp. URMC 124]|uniref:FDLD family class I lanthipeptide n=1 Tax=Streptomyces sp. URMC 124 TaxID=3423405 RepID=UPI003F1AE10C